MTEKELNKLHYLDKQIESIKLRIKEIEQDDGVSAIIMTGMPHGTKISNTTEKLVIKRQELKRDLESLLSQKIDEERKIRNYIENVDNEKAKEIMELRFLKQMNWEDIGKKVSMDRSYAARLMRRYLAQ